MRPRSGLLATEGRPVYFPKACYDGESHATAAQDDYEEGELELNAKIDGGLRREDGGEGRHGCGDASDSEPGERSGQKAAIL